MIAKKCLQRMVYKRELKTTKHLRVLENGSMGGLIDTPVKKNEINKREVCSLNNDKFNSKLILPIPYKPNISFNSKINCISFPQFSLNVLYIIII